MSAGSLLDAKSLWTATGASLPASPKWLFESGSDIVPFKGSGQIHDARRPWAEQAK